MNTAISTIPPASPPSIPARQVAVEMASVVKYALAAKTGATRRAYQSDEKVFKEWCEPRGLAWMPAEAGTVAMFLAAQADAGLTPSTLGRRAAAIAYAHKLAGHAAPTDVEAVKDVMRGIRREKGVKPVRKAPATAGLVRAMIDGCPPGLIGLRDRALLALGFAAGFNQLGLGDQLHLQQDIRQTDIGAPLFGQSLIQLLGR